MTKLQKLMRKATPEKWSVETRDNPRGPIIGLVSNLAPTRHIGTIHSKYDAALIAHAVNMLPRMIEALQAYVDHDRLMRGDMVEFGAIYYEAVKVLGESNNPEVSK